jgi:putative transposase
MAGTTKSLRGAIEILAHLGDSSLDNTEESDTMSSTHLSLYYHLIFSTKGRIPWIKISWENRLHSYLGGITRGLDGVAQEIETTADHIHILISLKASRSLSSVLKEIKASSSGWIHRTIGNRLFHWQKGYGAFTVSRSDVGATKRYIRGQKDHHRKKTFQEEYLHLLRQNGVEFDEKYLW